MRKEVCIEIFDAESLSDDAYILIILRLVGFLENM